MKKQQSQDQILPSREASRTLIRVEDVNITSGNFHVIIPGWNTKIKIRLFFKDLPPEIQILIEPGKRLHAKVNIGCEDKSELFFIDWEVD